MDTYRLCLTLLCCGLLSQSVSAQSFMECSDIELDTDNADQFVQTVKHLEPTFGGINLEDISAPDCFYIEEQLKNYEEELKTLEERITKKREKLSLKFAKMESQLGQLKSEQKYLAGELAKLG